MKLVVRGGEPVPTPHFPQKISHTPARDRTRTSTPINIRHSDNTKNLASTSQRTDSICIVKNKLLLLVREIIALYGNMGCTDQWLNMQILEDSPSQRYLWSCDFLAICSFSLGLGQCDERKILR